MGSRVASRADGGPANDGRKSQRNFRVLSGAFGAFVLTASLVAPAGVATATGPSIPQIGVGKAYSVSTLNSDMRDYLSGRSWHDGCPVGLDSLRLVVVRYVDFDGKAQSGPLVVTAKYADKIGSVFAELFGAKFPIYKLSLVDEFEADDDKSTLANNTSAFNCRSVPGSTHWSQHAYGAAVDINPLQNPYMRSDGSVLDPNAKQFLNRRQKTLGMIQPGDVVTRAFAKIGWGWGGTWRSSKDYQHFSSNGR